MEMQLKLLSRAAFLGRNLLRSLRFQCKLGGLKGKLHAYGDLLEIEGKNFS